MSFRGNEWSKFLKEAMMGVDILNRQFNGIFRGKTVLVTGHTGFKGSWLCVWLKQLGAVVVGYGLAPYTDQDNFEVCRLKDKVIDIRKDIRNIDDLKEVFRKYSPEFVFHLAAQPLVRLSYEIPKETYEVNVMGTMNVLECIRHTASVRVGIMITTDKCYRSGTEDLPHKETDPMGGYDPYSSSKACAEILISSYRDSFFNPEQYEKHGKSISSVRAGNVIGGGDWAKDRIIPDCIRALSSNQPIIIRNPKAVRPWQHVLEPLYGYLLLASKMFENGKDYCDGWNFGPDYRENIMVEEIVRALVGYWGHGEYADSSEQSALHEAGALYLDCSKARQRLGWIPKLGIKQAIEYTADWYMSYRESDCYGLCIRQINSYMDIEDKKEE